MNNRPIPKQIVRRTYKTPTHEAFLNLHPVLQRIYAARNVVAPHELDVGLKHLHPYHTLLGIDRAASLLGDAIMTHQRILIVGDFDADGATSSALAMRALKSFGAKNIQFLVPNRFMYGYGLTPELVDAAKQFTPDVMVTVDNGIANHAGVLAAKVTGAKVIITDHHLPPSELPEADVIVNPNQAGDPFPSKHLAGVGVIFYVMLAVKQYLSDQTWFTTQQIEPPNMTQFLDLVALGTVADLVTLDHNNRILVHQGLRRIRAGQCASGIIALLELANRDFTKATTADLGFAAAARLNAAGRMDDMSLGIACLLADDAVKAREIARSLDQFNDERKSVEQDMQIKALSIIERLQDKLRDLPQGLCLYDPDWHQGVIGILAARIKERYHRPTIVFAPGQAGELKGSARSIAGIHLRDMLALIDVQHPGLMIKFGGHAMAAGLSILPAHFNEFERVFDDVITKNVSKEIFEPLLWSDGALHADDLNLTLATLLRDSGPWGQAFPEPLFDDCFDIVEQRLVGDKHLKCRLMKDGKVIDAIAFFVDTNQWPNHRCVRLRALYRLDINEYKGLSKLQLIIDYFEAQA